MAQKESPGRLTFVFILFFIGAVAMVRGVVGLVHHEVIFRAHGAWLDPWQLIIGACGFVAIGLYILVSGLRNRRR